MAEKVTWVCSDVTEYQANTTFDLWHDRAVLHFFTEEQQRNNYFQLVNDSVAIGGYVILAEFNLVDKVENDDDEADDDDDDDAG